MGQVNDKYDENLTEKENEIKSIIESHDITTVKEVGKALENGQYGVDENGEIDYIITSDKKLHMIKY